MTNLQYLITDDCVQKTIMTSSKINSRSLSVWTQNNNDFGEYLITLRFLMVE